MNYCWTYYICSLSRPLSARDQIRKHHRELAIDFHRQSSNTWTRPWSESAHIIAGPHVCHVETQSGIVSNTMTQRQFVQEILLDPQVLLAFYDYVHKQHCHEALHFFLAATEYLDYPQPQRKKAEAAILAAYIVERAPEKINVNDSVMKKVSRRVYLSAEAYNFDAKLFNGLHYEFFTFFG